MSVAGMRELKEREVLATLLLRDFAYKELPAGFDENAFEDSEYKDLFAKFRYEFMEKEEPANVVTLGERYGQSQKLIQQVIWASPVLNGKLRSQAALLMNHRVGILEEQGTLATPARLRARDSPEFQFELMNGRNISEMELPPKSWLIQDLITEKSVAFLAGEEGCGKSLLAMNLALAVAVGGEYWLSYKISKHGKVLYLNNELAFDDFARRIKAMSQTLPGRDDIANLIVPSEVPAIRVCWNQLQALCSELKPCLVVVDCLYFSHDEDENDSTAMKSLMRMFLTLRDEFGLAILLLHHTKKGSRYTTMHNDNMRGSSVFGGSADTTLQIRRSATDEGKRILKPLKGRHVADSAMKCRLLSLNPENLWFRDEGEANEGEHIATTPLTAKDEVDFSAIFAESRELSRKDIQQRCKPLGYDERTIDRLMKQKLKTTKYGYYSL